MKMALKAHGIDPMKKHRLGHGKTRMTIIMVLLQYQRMELLELGQNQSLDKIQVTAEKAMTIRIIILGPGRRKWIIYSLGKKIGQ